ncbi:SulP family sulfate permease [Endobacter medicaginis]|uniref:SulP family sulfate permease n=2 Tax=Endobacter medicaginis TaxID=1181271 RepID=A0A839V0U9_9PROT|nr:SulP family sulfate permease [Endobacter medicaginis]
MPSLTPRLRMFARDEWFTDLSGLRRDILAGMVGTFALIPEVIAFSYVAGVDPAVGLYASFLIGLVIAFAGGRPAMISGAAGSVALVAAPLVRAHGIEYLLAATLLCGLLQVLFGLLHLDVLMRFVSRSVRTGFVNALAILIFSAQLPQILGHGPQFGLANDLMIGLGLVIVYLLPRLTRAIPSPLIAIVVLGAIAAVVPMPLHTVGDLGRLPDSLPALHIPAVPFDLATLGIVFPYALAMATVGMLESLMTAGVVDDETDTDSDKRRETAGLGLANLAAGAFGGIAGCGMIGQTVGNLRYGGRSRVSTLTAGVFLLICMVVLRPWVARVPVAALVAIMLMVSVSTFQWSSLRDLTRHPQLSSFVMLATVAVVVATSDLAIGVGVGVLLSGLNFAFRAARLMRVEERDEGDARVFAVHGPVLFASSDLFAEKFRAAALERAGGRVIIDLTDAHVWDITAAGTLNSVIERLRRHGVAVELRNLNEPSGALVRQTVGG